MIQEVMIGLAEAAQRLRVPYQNCHRLLMTGVLRGEKRDGRWYVHASDVERFASSGQPNSSQGAIMPSATKKQLEEENAVLRETLAEVSERIGDVLEVEETYEDEDPETQDE